MYVAIEGYKKKFKVKKKKKFHNGYLERPLLGLF